MTLRTKQIKQFIVRTQPEIEPNRIVTEVALFNENGSPYAPEGGEGGAVSSVNEQTGAVVLTAEDVGADPVGSASSAQLAAVASANTYADTVASDAQTAAIAHADSVASTAQTNAISSANTYTDNAIDGLSGGGSLPDHTGENGALYTDGTDLTWVPFPTIPTSAMFFVYTDPEVARPVFSGQVGWIVGDPAIADPTNLAVGDVVFRSQSFEVLEYAISDETTDLTTGEAKLTARVPFACTIVDVRASLSTASSSGAVTIDVNEGGASIFSSILTIDQSERTSTTSAAPAVVSDGVLADDAELTFDIVSGGVDATGAKIKLYVLRTAP